MPKKKKAAVRLTWKINPMTRVEKPVKVYDRKKERKKLLRLIGDNAEE